MVELWESTLNDYRYVDDIEIEGMRYRFHRDERALLERFVPSVMRSTFSTYVQRYGEAPPMPLSIEVFREPETFGIRSVGVPYAMQHGICFGHVVTSRSPSAGDFNWRQVLEHELSHVFSLHASANRVPRWFTEGLAEYDTILGNEGWRREHDLAMIQALQRGTLISVLELNRAFVSMDRPDAILEAYFQASLVVEYIGATHGHDALIEMLHRWRDDVQTPEVIENVLGQTVEEFDESFAAALRTQYGDQILIFEPASWWYSDYDDRVAAAEASPNEARVIAELAWAEFHRGEGAAAAAALERAMSLDARDPYGLYLSGQLSWLAGASSAASALFRSLIEDGHRSATAHSVIAANARAEGDVVTAARHLELAAELAPTDVTIVREQAAVAGERGDTEAQMSYLATSARLDQHDVTASVQVAEFAVSRNDLATASFFAGRAIDIAPFRADVQALSGRVAHAAGSWEVARRDLELAAETSSDSRAELLPLLLDAYQALGLDVDATRVRRELIE
jgi:tetratricopeptide (TPR) repeat protein